MVNEDNCTTIEIKNNLKKELDHLKRGQDSYSDVIIRLIDEPTHLAKQIQHLKGKNRKLNSQSLGTSGSPDLKFHNLIKTSFFISLVINNPSSTDEEDFEYLRTCLDEILSTNPSDVLIVIDDLIDMIGAEEEVPELLYDFKGYVEKLCFGTS